jgi:hypothetical protein
VLETLTDTIRDLTETASELLDDAPSQSRLEKIVDRGEFRPAEDEAIGFWFARYLGVRDSLWTVIENVLANLEDPVAAYENEDDLRYFLVGYAAACLLVRIDQFMLFRVARHSIIQRKLNEPFPEYGIPRKQYTTIFSAFVDETDALKIYTAMKFAKQHRRQLRTLATDEHVGFIARNLDELESFLEPSKLTYLRRAWRFVSHKWRRRGVVSAQNTLATVMERLGRTASDICDMRNKVVTAEIRKSIGTFLQPGDVLVTRHAVALTNLFLPGFWPHAAFYIGTPAQRVAAGIKVDTAKEALWTDDKCILEALKDGVRFRSLDETLAVDVFVVLRPKLAAETIARAIERAVLHEGKEYNFDFDFFNSDRVVCTEVVYRAYDGLEDLRFPLHERAGRKTLSAEDLLDFALESRVFEPVAIFGVKGCGDAILYGAEVRDTLIASYRRIS